MGSGGRRKKVRYNNSVVAYLDILGFRDLVKRSRAGEISRLIRIVSREIKPFSSFAKRAEIKFQTFSDLTVIAVPVRLSSTFALLDSALSFVVQHLGFAQSQLIDEGIVIRGSITVGDIVRSHGQLYGPALIRAYDLERREAIYPRIIVDELALSLARREKKTVNNVWRYLRKEKEGFAYVDYLRIRIAELDEVPQWLDFLGRHKTFIEQCLGRFLLNEKLTQKYLWLSSYHNAVVDEIAAGEDDLDLKRYLQEKFMLSN